MAQEIAGDKIMINSVVSFILALIVFSGIIYWYLKNQAQKSPTSKRSNFNSTNLDKYSPVKSSIDIDLVKNKWAEIEAMQQNGASGLKNALIEADKLLDYVMIAKGFSGETMGDRLKNDGHKFNNLNDIWSAHKLRNQIVHEVEHDIVASQVRLAITTLGAAINQLGVNIK